jgi:hypothetical protein
MTAAARRVTRLLDAAPVLILAGIAGAGSFVHIRDTAAQHGQHGPMSWAIAVCIDLTCVMAARERQRDKHTHRATRRLSWPTLVLTAGVLLSLAANLDQAQPDPWGRITAATPAAAFLTAVSMLERRATSRVRSDAPSAVVLPVPAQADHPAPVLPAGPAGLCSTSPARSPPSTTPPTASRSPATPSAPASACPTSSPPNSSATSAPPPTPPERHRHDRPHHPR